MKRPLLILLALLLITPPSLAQPGPSALPKPHIQARLMPGVHAEHVFITGSTEELGFWNPSLKEMKRLNDSLFVFYVHEPITQPFEFKITCGSWEKEALDSNLQIYANQAWDSLSFIHFVNVYGWTEPKEHQSSGITGETQVVEQIEAFGLLPRDLHVWLPPGYHNALSKRYPVLYMQDGQNAFDPSTSAYGVEWSIDETMTRLIEEKIIEPMIVVAIENTSDRSLEYLPGEKSDDYLKLVSQTIKPWIDSQFRTRSQAKDTYVGGSSAGATIAFMLAWTHPDQFGNALCFSPGFQNPEGFNDTFDFVDDVRATTHKPEGRFYIYNGGLDIDSLLQPGVDQMIEAFKELGMHEGKDFEFRKNATGKHNEATWAEEFPLGLLWILGKDC